jgi:hypothetical protein
LQAIGRPVHRSTQLESSPQFIVHVPRTSQRRSQSARSHSTVHLSTCSLHSYVSELPFDAEAAHSVESSHVALQVPPVLHVHDVEVAEQPLPVPASPLGGLVPTSATTPPSLAPVSTLDPASPAAAPENSASKSSVQAPITSATPRPAEITARRAGIIVESSVCLSA